MRIPLSRNGVFAAAVLAGLLPVIRFSYLPSGDGPAHVYNASLIGRYFFDPFDPVHELLQFNGSLPPNLMAHGVLALFMTLVPPHAAERLLTALYAILLPLALRYAMRAETGETRGVEFLGLPVVFNSHFHWGFYNFLAGLVTCLLAMGYWLRIRKEAPAIGRMLLMAVMVTAVYFSHPVPLIEFWLAAGALWVIAALQSRTWRAGELRQLILASLPAVGFYLHYLLTHPAASGVPIEWPPLRYAGSMLIKLYPLVTYTQIEKLAALALSAGIAAALTAVWRMKVEEPNARGYLYAAALLAVPVFAAPMQAAGGTLVTTRLVYFPLFFVLLWLSTAKWPASFATGFAAAGIVLAALGMMSRWPIYERYDQRMAGFLEMAHSRSGLPVEFFKNAGEGIAVNLDDGGTPYLAAGAWAYVAADRRSVLLSDYEASLDYFPFVYRDGVTPTASSGLLSDSGCPLADGLIDESRVSTDKRREISEVVWMDAAKPRDVACLSEHGKRIVAERRNADGTLLWIDGAR